MRFRDMRLVLFVGFLLTGLCVALYLARPQIIRTVSARAYDTFVRFTAKPPRSGAVCIVAIDEESLSVERYGQWEWPRYVLAKLADRLVKAGASVIAFDLLLAEPDRTSPSMMSRDYSRHLGIELNWGELPTEFVEHDAILAASLRGRRTVLGCVMHPQGPGESETDVGDEAYKGAFFVQGDSSALRRWLPLAHGIGLPVQALNESAYKGFLNTYCDDDMIVRRNPVVWGAGEGRIYPSLALEAVRLHLGGPRCRISFDQRTGLESVDIGKDHHVPVDEFGNAVINFRSSRPNAEAGIVSMFPVFAAADVLDGKVPAEALEGKIVFVGASAIGLKDVRATPMSPITAGVEVHAAIADNILVGDVLRQPGWLIGADALLIVLVGTILTLMLAHVSAWLGGAVTVLLVTGICGLSYLALRYAGFVFVPVWSVTTAGALYPVLTGIRFWQADRVRRRTRHMFARMVSEEVLNYLEEHPESFSLTGRRVDATMLFCDVAGFTTFAEHMEAEALSRLMNRYLSAMTEVIISHGGYVDKYEGDLIMAVWGAPYPMEDHALAACRAAVAMQKTLERLRPSLRAEFDCDLYARIGINSGRVVAGNMGSEQRFDYTVLGDAVNLASRIEPLNREYGTDILVGTTTADDVKVELPVTFVDEVHVKGREKLVRVYTIGDNQSAAPDVESSGESETTVPA